MTPTLAGHHQDSISNPHGLSDSKEALWGREQPRPFQHQVSTCTGLLSSAVILTRYILVVAELENNAPGIGMLAHCTTYGPDPRFSPPPQKRKTRSGYPRLVLVLAMQKSMHTRPSIREYGTSGNFQRIILILLVRLKI